MVLLVLMHMLQITIPSISITYVIIIIDIVFLLKNNIKNTYTTSPKFCGFCFVIVKCFSLLNIIIYLPDPHVSFELVNIIMNAWI